MRINTEIIDKYDLLQEKLPVILESYGIKKAFLLDRVGMARSTFLLKIRNKSFTSDELKKIANVINSKEGAKV